MRTLHLLAYSCEPNRGSEPGAGWAFLRGSLAAEKQVRLYTRPHRVSMILEALSDQERELLTVVPIRTPQALLPLRRRHRGQMLDYAIFQYRLLRELRSAVRPGDVVHHVTYASDWFPVAAIRVRVPLVLGPVGGYTTRAAMELARARMSHKAFGKERTRKAITQWLRGALVRGLRARSSRTLLLANNDDVAAHFRSRLPNIPVVVEPHVAVDIADGPQLRNQFQLLFVGRLIAWKGCHLAIEALAHLPVEYRLRIAGDGPEAPRLRALAASLGLADRIDLLGVIPRHEVLTLMANSGGLLFPSLHDSAPFAVAEALAAGCPVVCLDLGGPATLVRRASGGCIVPPEPASQVASALAHAVLKLPSLSYAPNTCFSTLRLPPLLRGWYESVSE